VTALAQEFCAYEVDCEDIVDLTTPEGCAARGILYSDLACAWADRVDKGLLPPSWVAVDGLMAAGFAGMLVKSFAVGALAQDINAVFWRWAPVPPHQVRVVDPEARLPRNDLSWR
jgi:RES domain-containing protein